MGSVKVVIIAAIGIIVIGAVVVLHKRTLAPPEVTYVQTEPGAIRYLPLGDSYTIGQSVSQDQRWPNQLVSQLQTDGVHWQIVANPSVTGYTTQNLIDRELPLVSQLKPDVVSVLIGVNDYVQGVDINTFHAHFIAILDSLQKSLTQPGNIFVVTIPDYAKTPTGAQYGDPTESTTAITQFNDIIKQEAAARKLPVTDIFSISQGVVQDPSLTADDGLHPSGAQYAQWTAAIYQTLTATTLLKKS